MIVFCPGCGTRISAAPAPLDPEGTVTCPKCKSRFATSEVKADPNATAPRRKLRPKSQSSSRGVGIAISLLALALLGAGIWAVMHFGLGSTSTALLSGGSSTNSSRSTEWREYKSAEGRFRVMLPGAPTRKVRSSKEVEFGLETPDAKIGVVYADLPEKVKPEKYMVAPSGSKVLSEKDVTQGDYSGRDIVADVPQHGTTHMRFLTTGKRLYTVMIVGKGRSLSDSEVARVLDSFQITG
jgi:hypothetical protein